MAIAFLLTVILYGHVKGWFVNNGPADSGGYTSPQIISAVLAETLRAIATTWLYLHHGKDKSRLANALLFGLVCSLLVGSLWIFLGAGFFNPENKISFVVNDSIILILQGMLSGLVLWLVFKPDQLSF